MNLDNRKERFSVVPEYILDQRDQMYLLYDYRNHNWIFLNAHGKKIFDLIERGLIPTSIIENISKEYGQKYDAVKDKVLEFIRYLIDMEFVFLDEYIPKPPPVLENRKSPKGCSIVFEKCNLNCVYCYNKKTRTEYLKKYREMTTQEFKTALKKLVDFGLKQMMFSGGEPTLRSDLVELAQFVKSKNKNLKLALITNGTNIDQNNAKSFAGLFDLIWVSLDSYKREEHETLRGKGTYTKTVGGIKLLLKSGAKNLLVNSMVSGYNYQSMEGTRDFVLNKLGVHHFRMSEFQPYKNIGTFDKKIDLTSPPDSFTLRNENLMRQADLEQDGFENLVNKGSELMPRIHCGVAHGEISLHSNGDIFPCQNLTDEIFRCGNVLTESIERIFNESPVMKRLREATVERIESCKSCEVKYICHGGCRASAYEIHGSELAAFGEKCSIRKKSALNRLWEMPAIPFKKVKETKEKTQKYNNI